MTKRTDTWTEALTAAVIADWNADMSVNAIAAKHGLKRNQVSAKISRLRASGVELESRGAPAGIAKARARGRGIRRTEPIATAQETAGAVGSVSSVQTLSGSGLVRPLAVAPVAGGCRFIEGDDFIAKMGRGEGVYCGKPRVGDGPYCAQHRAICHVPPKSRLRE